MRLHLNDPQKCVMGELWRNGPLSRLQIAHRISITPAAMTKISKELLDLGFVEEITEAISAGRGRPGVPLRISPRGGHAVGVTLHEKLLEIILIDYAGTVIDTRQEYFDDPDPLAFALKLRRGLLELTERYDLLGSRFLGVGLALPAHAYSAEGDRWHTVESLALWREVPIRRMLSETLALPVWIENDANASALAEYYIGGLGRRCATAIVILLGHGIGAGVIDQGRLLRGEIGNVGQIGCLYPIMYPRPTPLDLLGELRRAGAPIDSIADFETGLVGYETLIDNWITRASRQLDLVVHSALAWFDPGEIVLASPLPHWLLDDLAQRLMAQALQIDHGKPHPPISISKLGAHAPTLGAALLPVNAVTSFVDGFRR